MASSRSSALLSPRTKSTKLTKTTGIPFEPKFTSAYDNAFEQYAIDNGIYPPFHVFPDNRPTRKPYNLDTDRQILLVSRPSLSLSLFTESAFEDFQRSNNTVSETTVRCNVIPIIAGNSDIPNEADLLFTNIEPIVEALPIKAKPDFFDGALAGDIHPKIRNADEDGNLNKLIIPTKHASAPVAPNFFLETKAAKGGADVALRQALYDGSIGARAMHALQNYGAEEPACDGNAYTYSSTYHAGTATLQLYAHHPAAPTAPGSGPEYHMTLVKAFAMTSDRDTFVQGATAFRNARNLAQTHRVRFIQAANAKARQSGVEAPPEPETTVAAAEQYEDSSADEFVDCEDYATQAVGSEDDAAPGDVDGESALPHYLEDEEPSQESTALGAEPAMSFATSVTSSFSAQSQTSSKRNRDSPPPNPRPCKKHDAKKHDSTKKRIRRGTPRRASESSA